MMNLAEPASRYQTTSDVPITLTPLEGWHVTHSYYRWDRAQLRRLDDGQQRMGCEEFVQILRADSTTAPQRLQTSIVSGHKADFAVLAMDPQPLLVDTVHQRLLASALGPALVPVYSFVSLTEVSEYLPSVEQYGEKLAADGHDVNSDEYRARLKAYAAREPEMRRQRLTPDLPDWPATCFYPMNKKRVANDNWFLLPFAERSALMSEHARSGVTFAGRVSQLITVATGLDDWEWGVTLWAKNPQFLKDIVYRMRFDEASARFAEFGPFFVSYLASGEDILDHCRCRPDGR